MSTSSKNTSGGTVPSNLLNRRSKKVSCLAPRTSIGHCPFNLLLLRSSSKKYGSFEISLGMTPVKLLESTAAIIFKNKKLSSAITSLYVHRTPESRYIVAAVDFNGFQFGGKDGLLPLSGFIEMIPDITVFHANSNSFTGVIPRDISKLPYFFELDLINNKLKGQCPMEVLGAKQLTFLDLRFNKFEGTVPPQVFLLDVDIIFINNNNFYQNLPSNLGSTPANFIMMPKSSFCSCCKF
ncbi:hypothetical protein FH972_027234 [Carpinus fangiana]|uniref:Uncharacterized protein n=1 Tax=Carpinus fangiana TaxID=176857 RepID=A0A5N6L6G4_9ROSI|nr:hypothetical protein FH972_027234 [Carpinus fangiana]